MASNYQIVSLPGSSNLKVASVDIKNSEDGGVKSPEWMVSIDGHLKSTITGFETSAELFAWHGESSRFTTGDISGQHFTSATLKHSDLVLQINNGGHGPELEQKMNKGILLEKIMITRLGNVQQVKVKLQEILYETSRLQKFQQELDRIWLFFTITKRTNTVFVYDNGGQGQGQMVSMVDYSKNDVE